MTPRCTVICPSRGFADTIAALERTCRLGDVMKYVVDGEATDWERIVVNAAGDGLTLTSMIRTEPGDKFSRLVLSMDNFFRTVRVRAASNHQYAMSRIQHAELMIGVVAKPDFRDDDPRQEALHAIAETLDAVIFDGTSLLTPRGERILSKDGSYDTIVKKRPAKE